MVICCDLSFGVIRQHKVCYGIGCFAMCSSDSCDPRRVEVNGDCLSVTNICNTVIRLL